MADSEYQDAAYICAKDCRILSPHGFNCVVRRAYRCICKEVFNMGHKRWWCPIHHERTAVPEKGE